MHLLYSHIQEHMQVPIDTSKMSEAELQFHYFKMHDSDNNNKLDGCELIKSLIHWHGKQDKPSAPFLFYWLSFSPRFCFCLTFDFCFTSIFYFFG